MIKTYTPEPYTLSDFDFVLPESLIAQTPAASRTASRLLKVISEQQFTHATFADIANEFVAGDVLVINNTKVMPARLLGKKLSGGRLEIFVERIQSETTALCMIKANRSPKIDSTIYIANETAKIVARRGVFFLLELSGQQTWAELTKQQGDIPLPPYIQRQTTASDVQRYQTVYAEKLGAVAAPTAGLHFDQALLQQLKNKGVIIAEVTLHVGAGTFQPVKSECLDEHQMHFELFDITEKTRQIVNKAKQENRRITAVGTTSVRALESAAECGQLVQCDGDTNLFIRPGYTFEIVDRLITNFHLPKSSLMMLVSAFSGYTTIRNAYQVAIDEKYRFFSYGDAMLLKRR